MLEALLRFSAAKAQEACTAAKVHSYKTFGLGDRPVRFVAPGNRGKKGEGGLLLFP